MEEQRCPEVLLQEAESKHKSNRCKVTWDKVLRTRTALNTLLSQNAEKALFKHKHKIYEYANRSGWYLSNLISSKSPNNFFFTRMKDKNGKLYYITAEITQVFSDFYSSLYTSESLGMAEKMNDFFQCIQLPNVSEEDRYKFDTDITSEEVEGVICSLASGKACGPDGLPPEIYKSFKDILSPLLTRMFKHSLLIKRIPQ